jgi:hypothetical protein
MQKLLPTSQKTSHERYPEIHLNKFCSHKDLDGSHERLSMRKRLHKKHGVGASAEYSRVVYLVLAHRHKRKNANHHRPLLTVSSL